MAGTLNKVQIIGNLGKDVEVRSFPNGGRVASFSVATSESWKDKTTGEKKERVEWHRVSVLNDNLIPICEKYLKKGSKVYIEGQLETRKWTDKDGAEKYTTEVVLRPFRGEITMLDSKGGKSETDDAGDPEPEPKGGGNVGSDINDDIPFITNKGAIQPNPPTPTNQHLTLERPLNVDEMYMRLYRVWG